MTYSWVAHTNADVVLQVASPGDRILRLRAWPYDYPGAPAQTLALDVNGTRCGSFTMASGPRVYEAAAPAVVWRRGANTLTLSFAYAEAPHDRQPPSPDRRTLAAAVDFLDVFEGRVSR